jgi:hypothetical protein
MDKWKLSQQYVIFNYAGNRFEILLMCDLIESSKQNMPDSILATANSIKKENPLDWIPPTIDNITGTYYYNHLSFLSSHRLYTTLRIIS